MGGRVLCLCLALGLAHVSPTLAAGDSCDDFPQSSSEKSCSELEMDAANLILDGVLDEIRARLAGDVEMLAALERTHDAWTQFARAECAFKGVGIGSGSTRALIFHHCMAGMATSRSTALDALFHCEEGDLTCRVPSGE